MMAFSMGAMEKAVSLKLSTSRCAIPTTAPDSCQRVAVGAKAES